MFKNDSEGNRKEVGYCCLGVAEVVRGCSKSQILKHSTLTLAGSKYYGFDYCSDPIISFVVNRRVTASFANDVEGWSFKKIARAIERTYALQTKSKKERKTLMNRTQWTGHTDNQWRAVGPSTPNLKPALYALQATFGGWHLEETTPKHDNIVRIGAAETLFAAMQSFAAQRETYKKMGFLHKCGFLLAGPPGTGKTIAAITACLELIAKGGAAFILPPNMSEYPELMVAALRATREVHPDMPLAAIWEDIDAICGQNGSATDRAMMTSLLDGETQIDNVVHIATTNYYDRLDKAFRNRPGRFRVLWVGPPNRDVRLAYLKAMLPEGNPKLIEEVATKSDGLILDHLKSMLVDVFIHQIPVDDVIKHLKEMNFKSENAAEMPTLSSVFAPMFQKILSKGSA